MLVTPEDTRCAKFLAVFCDIQLKRGLKGRNEDEVVTVGGEINERSLGMRNSGTGSDFKPPRLGSVDARKKGGGGSPPSSGGGSDDGSDHSGYTDDDTDRDDTDSDPGTDWVAPQKYLSLIHISEPTRRS